MNPRLLNLVPAITLRALSLLCMLLAPTIAFAQIASQAIDEVFVPFESATIDNPTESARYEKIGTVHLSGAAWVQVHVGAYSLGRSSELILTSVADGQEQRLDARSLPQSYGWSAMFTGEEVEIELRIASGDLGVYVSIDQARTSQRLAESAPAAYQRSICGDLDDRVAYNDSRVARLNNCTAWLVSNGAVLSAGHCPIAAGDMIEFNVPASTPSGLPLPAAPIDQYPVNIASVRFQDDGRGEDWMVFGVNPNTTSGAKAHLKQGFFFMTLASPAIDSTLQVTGFGLDNRPGGAGGAGAACCDSNSNGICENDCNSNSQTQQSDIGPLDDLDGSIIEHDVDTMPANSGSPIIWGEGGEYTIGIHTEGGCDDFVSGYDNHGTRFNNGGLAVAIQTFPGPNTVYVDWGDTGLPANGNVFEPFRTVGAAVGAVADGGIIAFVPGDYPRAAGNAFIAGADGKAMTFLTPVGGVTIGE